MFNHFIIDVRHTRPYQLLRNLGFRAPYFEGCCSFFRAIIHRHFLAVTDLKPGVTTQ